MDSSDLSRTHTEIFMQDFSHQNDILIHDSSRNSVSLKVLESCREWSQTFDLNDAAIILTVRGNQMSMKLVHFTERYLNQFLKLKQDGQVQAPDFGQTFNKGFGRPQSVLNTEESQRNQLRLVFEKYSSAKLMVEGLIVPNIVLTKLDQVHQKKELRTDNYILSFATSANKIYQIEFDPFFFQINSRVRVNGPYNLDLYGQTKSFELVKSYKAQKYQFEYVIGTSAQANLRGGEDISDVTLYLLQGDFQSGFELKQLNRGQGNIVGGLIKGLKSKVNDLIQNTNATMLLGGQKAGTQLGTQVLMRNQCEEGVVAIKALTNCFFAVVYTNGVLRVWSAESEKLITQYDLLNEEKIVEEQRPALNQRVVKCKLDFTKAIYHTGDVNMDFELSVAFGTQSLETFQTEWKMTQLNLQAILSIRGRTSIDDANANIRDLSEEPMTSILQSHRVFGKGIEIEDLKYEYNLNMPGNNLWLVKWSDLDQESSIIDLKSHQYNLWTREDSEKYQVSFDQPDLPIEVLQQPESEYSEFLMRHYAERLLLKDRFRPQSIVLVINQIAPQFPLSQPVTQEQLLRMASTLNNHLTLVDVLMRVQIYEKQFSRISSLSRKLGSDQFRLIIRPIGISLLKQDTILTSLETFSNLLGLQLQGADKTLRDIRQVIPHSFEDDDFKLTVFLLASVKQLHLSSLPYIDQVLINDLQRSLAEVLQTVLRDSFKNQALQHELIEVIEVNREKVEAQIQQIIDIVLREYLESIQSAEGNYRQSLVTNHRLADKIVSLSLLPSLERSLFQELTSLYSLLRDISLVKYFIEANRPMIGKSELDFIENQEQLSKFEAWMRQLNSLLDILETPFEQNWIERGAIEDKTEIETVFTFFQYKKSLDRNTLLTYLVAKKRSNHHLFLSGQEFLFSYLFEEFLKDNTFQPDASLFQYPKLARELFQLQQLDLADRYLMNLTLSEMSQFFTYPLQFIHALAAAQNDQPKDFAVYLRNCILLFKQMSPAHTSLEQLLFTQSRYHSEEILTSLIAQPSLNFTLQFFLALTMQFKGMDHRYELFILLQALQESYITDQENDFFQERIFQTAMQIPQGIEFMYDSIIKTIDRDQRKVLLGQFLLHITGLPQQVIQKVNISATRFSHTDIDLAYEFLVSKIESDLPKQPSSENLRSVQNQLRALISVSQMYSREVELSRYLWELERKLNSLINKCLKSQIQAYQDLLNLQVYVLKALYLNALTFQENALMIVDDTQVAMPTSKDQDHTQKRARSSLARQLSQHENVEENIEKRGYSYIKDLQTDSDDKLPNGQVKVVSVEEIKRELIFAEGRLLASEYLITNEVGTVVRVLSEMKEFNFAIDLALSLEGEHVSYPIMVMMKELYASHEDKEDSKRQDVEISGSEKAKRIVEAKLQEVIPRINLQTIITIAQGIISQGLDVPSMIVDHIVRSGQAYQLIQFYLSDQNTLVEKCLDLILNNDKKAIVKQLADVDIQLLVLLLETLSDCRDENNQQIEELKASEADQLKLLRLNRTSNDIDLSGDFEADLMDYLNCGSRDYLDDLMQRNELGEGNDARLDQIRVDIIETQKLVDKVANGIMQMSEVVKAVLNGQ